MRRTTEWAHSSEEYGFAVKVWSDLLPYKYPRIVEFVADLPKTGTGKIDWQALRSGTSNRAG